MALLTRAWVLRGELGNKSFEVSRLPVAIFQVTLFNHHGKAQPPLRSHLLSFTIHYLFSGIGLPFLVMLPHSVKGQWLSSWCSSTLSLPSLQEMCLP